MSDSLLLWIVARQARLSVEFSKQEYWSGLTFLPPGDCPNPGTDPAFPVSSTEVGSLSAD